MNNNNSFNKKNNKNSNKIVFLTYNEWIGDVHKGIEINTFGLNAEEVQWAIENYSVGKEFLAECLAEEINRKGQANR